MSRAPEIPLSRRNLLLNAAAGTSLVVVAPLLGDPATTLAQTPGGAALAATPTSTALLDAVPQTGIDTGLVGIALRVERGEDLLFEGAAGLARMAGQTPLATTDRFGIGSITKTFTSVLILQLIDEGVLTLDDTVSQWLTDPVVGLIPDVDLITIRQLLTHTSGIYDYFDDDSAFWQDAYFGESADWTRVWTPLEVLAYADGARHAPYFAPGEGIEYSNTGYVLLGLIGEQASHQKHAEQLQTRILDPLGLTNTFYAATEPVPGGRVDCYHVIEGNLVDVSSIHLSALGTAGGMVSTAEDLASFARALFDGELMSQESLAQMTTFIPTSRPNLEGGMGLFRLQLADGTMLIGNQGDSPGFATRMFQPIDTELTIVMLTNTGGDDDVIDAVYAQAVDVAVGIVE